MRLLAGDIGGTKTNLAIFSAEAGPRAPLAEATFPSTEYPSLEAVVRAFLSDANLQVERATFGVAGPVVAGRASVTNLPWMMQEAQLADTLGLSQVHLLNDLEAIANGVPFLDPDDLYALNEGQPAPGGAIAVIAPGTGLGEAFLTWDGARYQAHASEGGHASFAPMDALERDLLGYLENRFEHVSCERVCSGIGLPNIYAFLRDSGHTGESDWVVDKLAEARDRTPVIASAALDPESPCPLCIATLNTFASILGAEAGNLALKVLSTGGVYLGGGIPPRILPVLKQGRFLDAFQRKGRMSDLLARIPVHVVLNPKVALLGAACHGLAL